MGDRCFLTRGHYSNQVLLNCGYRPRLGRKERGGTQKAEGSEPECVK